MRGLEAVVRHAREHSDETVTLARLAQVGGMSPATLERRLRRVLELSPRRLIVRTRLQAAVHRIVTTAPLGEIAAACGFFDQATINRPMRAHLGIIPGSPRASDHQRARPAVVESDWAVEPGAEVGREVLLAEPEDANIPVWTGILDPHIIRI